MKERKNFYVIFKKKILFLIVKSRQIKKKKKKNQNENPNKTSVWKVFCVYYIHLIRHKSVNGWDQLNVFNQLFEKLCKTVEAVPPLQS